MIPEVLHVLSRREENKDTFTLELTPKAPFVFQPGQFNMIYVPGFSEVAISISAGMSSKIVHTIRAVGAATKQLQKASPGAALGIRGPFGNSWPLKQADRSHTLFIAGGIGLAPLRPAIEQLAGTATERASLGLFTDVYYGARSPEDLIFHEDLKRWSTLPNFRVLVSVDRADRSWNGHVGVVTSLMRSAPSGSKIAMVCGPEVMMRFAAMKLTELGLKNPDIFLSTERNMKCAIGICGHCQFGPDFICKDGPIFNYDRIGERLKVREL